jgi:hypothetical protein
MVAGYSRGDYGHLFSLIWERRYEPLLDRLSNCEQASCNADQRSALLCPAPKGARKQLALELELDMLCCYGQVKRLAIQRGKRRKAWLFFPLAKTDSYGLHRHMCFAGFNLLRWFYCYCDWRI